MIPINKSGPHESNSVAPVRRLWAGDGSLFSTVTYASTSDSGETRWKEGFRVKDFNKRRAAGELLPHTPYKAYMASFDRYGEWRQRNTSNNVVTHLDPFIGTGAYPTMDELKSYAPDDLRIYLQAAASRINGQGHDSLTFLAEVRKVRAMFEKTLTRMVKLVNQAERRKLVAKAARLSRRDPLYFTKLLSQLWLEGRYGWRTLYFDIVDLDSAIREFDAKRTRFSERAGTSYSDTYTTVTPLSGSQYWEVTTVDHVSISARGALTADIRPPRFKFNPVETAWELMPWSFVIDWLLDVGAALASASFLALQTDYSASTGYQLALDRRIDRFPVPFVQGHDDMTGTFAYSNVSVVYKERNPASLSIIPQLTVNLDAWKVFDLLALFLVGQKSTQQRR